MTNRDSAVVTESVTVPSPVLMNDLIELSAGMQSPVELGYNRNTLASWFASWGLNTGAEIGVESGLFSRTLLQSNPNLKLFSIDQWQRYPAYRDHVTQSKIDGFYDKAKERLAPFGDRSRIIRSPSMWAVQDFPDSSLDFVYIDANHSFDYVMQDIIEWSKKVRRGGIVAGHDYNRRKRYEDLHVVEAVQAYTGAHKIKPFFTVGGAEEVRSFFWVKP